jgi:hypothetical protein
MEERLDGLIERWVFDKTVEMELVLVGGPYVFVEESHEVRQEETQLIVNRRVIKGNDRHSIIYIQSEYIS